MPLLAPAVSSASLCCQRPRSEGGTTSSETLATSAVAATVSTGVSEDQFAAGSCFTDPDDAEVKRSSYSNYGDKVDIAAAGSVMGFSNGPSVDSNWGTSYSTPLVAATVGLMQSINPNLTPSQIRSMLRSSALPVQNTVDLTDLPAAAISTLSP